MCFAGLLLHCKFMTWLIHIWACIWTCTRHILQMKAVRKMLTCQLATEGWGQKLVGMMSLAMLARSQQTAIPGGWAVVFLHDGIGIVVGPCDSCFCLDCNILESPLSNCMWPEGKGSWESWHRLIQIDFLKVWANAYTYPFCFLIHG